MDPHFGGPPDCKQYKLIVSVLVVSLIWSRTFVSAGSSIPTDLSSVHNQLKELALTLPLRQFEDDHILHQKWDEDSDTTHYWHPKLNKGRKPVYQRHGNDGNTQVIILSQAEDNLPRTQGTKQTFVVLRQKSGLPDYYPLFAYLRNSLRNEDCQQLTLSGIKKCVEWDSWEMRSTDEATIWGDCSSSIFLSCGFNVTVFQMNHDFAPIVPLTMADEGDVDDTLPSQKKGEINSESRSDDASTNKSTDYDFFDDLTGRRVNPQGRFFGSISVNVGGFGVCIGIGGGCSSSAPSGNTKPHPIQYSQTANAAAQCSQCKDAKLMGKPNYKNYQPASKKTMTPYRIGVTSGTFTPENKDFDSVFGKLYVFGPGSLDVFKANEDSKVFGKELPDDKGTIGSYMAEKSDDPNNLLQGVLIPVDDTTAYFVRNGLSYPGSFTTPAGIPQTGGFVIALANKTLFYPDSFISNHLQLNRPLFKPIEGKIIPTAQWAKEFESKKGTLLPRRWGPSVFVHKDDAHTYGKFEAADGKTSPVRVLVFFKNEDNTCEFYALEEQLAVKGTNPIVGKVTEEASKKTHDVIAIPGSMNGLADQFVSANVYKLEPIMFTTSDVRLKEPKGFMVLPTGDDDVTGQGLNIFVNGLRDHGPAFVAGTLTRENGKAIKGSTHVDTPHGPHKFSPIGNGVTKSIGGKKFPYASYAPAGKTKEGIKYVLGEELGTFQPDLKEMPEKPMKITVFGMDKLDILEASGPVFGKDYPDDHGITGRFEPTNQNQGKFSITLLHGILIPIDAKRGAFLRDGLGFPGKFKSNDQSTKEIGGFLVRSLKQSVSFFYPESFKTYGSLKLFPWKQLPGEFEVDKTVDKGKGPTKGTLLPRKNGHSIFITNDKIPQGAFQDKDKKFPKNKILMIPGTKGRMDEFYPIEKDVLPGNEPIFKGRITVDDPAAEILITVVSSPFDDIPDQFFPTEHFETISATFIPDGKSFPLEGFILKEKNTTIPPTKPVEVALPFQHNLQFPSRTLGVLKTGADDSTRGSILVNYPNGFTFTFYPSLIHEELAAKSNSNSGPVPSAKTRYPTYCQIGNQSTFPITYVLGETSGQFKPDDTARPSVSVSGVVKGIDTPDLLLGKNAIFGPDALPMDKGTPGTYTPDKKFAKAKPIHGVLLPVDETMGYLIRDGIGFTAYMKEDKSGDKVPGFYIPLRNKNSDLFYPDSPAVFSQQDKAQEIPGTITPECASFHDIAGTLFPKKSGPSLFIRNSQKPVVGTFEDSQGLQTPMQVKVVPKSNGYPDQFFPIDTTSISPDDGLLKGKIWVGSRTKPVSIMLKSKSDMPDEFILDEEAKLEAITFTPKGNSKQAADGYLILPKDCSLPPESPVPINFDSQKMAYPAQLSGTLHIPSIDQDVPGTIITSSAGGPHKFVPGTGDAVENLDQADIANALQKLTKGANNADKDISPDKKDGDTPLRYPNYITLVSAKLVSSQYVQGITVGTFVPTTENQKKPLPISIHTLGTDKLDGVVSETPVFGQELPEDRGTEGTFNPEAVKGKSSAPIRGILIPIDKYRSYMLRDGISLPATFTPTNVNTPSLSGFIVPSLTQASQVENFYPESYITFLTSIRTRVIAGDIKLENPTEESKQHYPASKPGKMILRSAGPSKFIPDDSNALEVKFTSNKKPKPFPMFVIRGKNGKPDQFFPIDDNLAPEGDTPTTGSVSIGAGVKITIIVLQEGCPDAEQKVVTEDDGEIKLITISSSESKVNNLKGYMVLPKGHEGPPVKPTFVSIPNECRIIPGRIQVTVTMPDNSMAVGLLAANTPRGPYTYYPGMKNPIPTSIKPVTYPKVERSDDEENGEEPEFSIAGTQTADPKSTNPLGANDPIRKSTMKYPSYKRKGTRKSRIQYVVGKARGVFTPDNDGQVPVPVTLATLGVDLLDVVESSTTIFPSSLPDNEGTPGTFTPTDTRRNNKPLHGVLVPISARKGYLIRDDIGYTGKFTPNDKSNKSIYGFVLPPLKAVRDTRFFIPESFPELQKGYPNVERIDGELEPDKETLSLHPVTKGQLILRPQGPSIFFPSELSPVKVSFKDESGASPEADVVVLPGEKDVEIFSIQPVATVLKMVIKGIIILPSGKELKIARVPARVANYPDEFIPDDKLKPVKITPKDLSIPPLIISFAYPTSKKNGTVDIFVDRSNPLPSSFAVSIIFPDNSPGDGVLTENYPDGPFTFKPGNESSTDEKPGGKTRHPEYVQNYRTPVPPNTNRLGVSAGSVLPDKEHNKPLPAILKVSGGDKMDVLEFENPTFGTSLPESEASPVTYTPVNRLGSGNPIHGVVIPVDDKHAYLIPDGVAFTGTFSPNDHPICPTLKGFIVVPPLTSSRQTNDFCPESLFDLRKILVKQPKPVLTCKGTMTPDAETAGVHKPKSGKLIMRPVGPSVWIPDDVAPQDGQFESENAPPLNIVYIPGKNGSAGETYPVDNVNSESDEPIKGKIITAHITFIVIIIPTRDSGTRDEIVSGEDTNTLPVTINSDDEQQPLRDVKGHAIMPRDESKKQSKKTALLVVIPSLSGHDTARKIKATLTFPNGKTQDGLLFQETPGEPHKFIPGMKNPVLGPITETEQHANKATDYPNFVQYGTSNSPLEYHVGVSRGFLMPENGVKKRIPATVHVPGVDNLDVVEIDAPTFGTEYPCDKGMLATYTPQHGNQPSKPIRGVLIPVSEKTAYLVRDNSAYTGTFFPLDGSPLSGFVLPPLGGQRRTEFFIPESLMAHADILQKKPPSVHGTLLPDEDVEALFLPSKGRLVVRPNRASVFFPDSDSDDVVGKFKDETGRAEVDVLVIPGLDGKLDEVYPIDTLAPGSGHPTKGTITTPEKDIEALVIPQGADTLSPEVVVPADKTDPKLVKFINKNDLDAEPLLGYLLAPKVGKISPKKPSKVVITNEFQQAPLVMWTDMELLDGTTYSGVLASNSANGSDHTFYLGMREPKSKSDSPDASSDNAPPKKSKRPKNPSLALKPSASSASYTNYAPLGVSSDSHIYNFGEHTGTFVADDKPKKAYPIHIQVLGIDKADIIIATDPIFGGDLSDQKATVGTFTPDENSVQKPLHGAAIPLDATTALFIRDGLGYPVTLTENSQKPLHGFFIPLMTRPIEVWYPDSVVAFAPTSQRIKATGGPATVEITPNNEVKMLFRGDKGYLFPRKLCNIFIGNKVHSAKFESDDGKVSVPLKYVKGLRPGMADEFIVESQQLPKLAALVLGKVTLEDSSIIIVTIVSLPDAEDTAEYKIFPDIYIVKNIIVNSPDKRIKNENAYWITLKFPDDKNPLEIIIFEKFLAPFPTDTFFVTITDPQGETIKSGRLTTVLRSGPHFFLPTTEIPKDDKSILVTIETNTEIDSDSDDDNASIDPSVFGNPSTGSPINAVGKIPSTMTTEEKDNWPSNLAYEPFEEEYWSDRDVAKKPQEKKQPTKRERAVQAIILPLDPSSKYQLPVRGKVPAIVPKWGQSIYFILDIRDSTFENDYFRGFLRLPGSDHDDLRGALTPQEKSSIPPKFVVDPEHTEPALFYSSENPNLKIYGYIVPANDPLLFRPDNPKYEPQAPTQGVIRRPMKKPLKGWLLPPPETRKPSPFVDKDPTPREPVDLPAAEFFPDYDGTNGMIKGTLKDKQFTPNEPSRVEQHRIPLHGLVVHVNVDILPEYSFLRGTPSAFEFIIDPDTYIIAEFQPDSSPDIVIKGVYIEPVNGEDCIFIPSDYSKPPPLEAGKLYLRSAFQDPLQGVMKQKSDNEFIFVTNSRQFFPATFYPDLENVPMEGIYHPSEDNKTGEFQTLPGSPISEHLPMPGQLIPGIPSQPQKHGVLKKIKGEPPTFIFIEDDPDKASEYEVCFVSMTEERGELLDIATMGISVRGYYFLGVANITIFIPLCGAAGHLVSNKMSPVEPNAVKFQGTLFSHGEKATEDGEHYVFSFTPNYNADDNGSPDEFESTAVFYPFGSIVGGIDGKVVKVNEYEWALVTTSLAASSRWKPPPGVYEFVYNNRGQLTPYDPGMIHLQQIEREGSAGQKVKGGYYKGAAGVNVLIPEGVKTGAMFILSDEEKVHGSVSPLGRGEQLAFYTEDEKTIAKLILDGGGQVPGLLDPDESLSVEGKTPNNGIPCVIIQQGNDFIVRPTEMCQWGFFIPGKKVSISIVIMMLDVFKPEDGWEQSAFFTHDVYAEDDDDNGFSRTGAEFGRALGKQDAQGRCEKLRESYFIHEPNGNEGVVVQVCRVKDENHVHISDRKGYYPFKDVNDDEMDEHDNIRVGTSYPSSTRAHMFVTHHGVAGDFRIKTGSHGDDLTTIPGRIYNTPDPARLLFKPHDMLTLLEQVGGAANGQFKSVHGIGEEGLLEGKLIVDGTGIVGRIELKHGGEFGAVYFTGHERIVKGTSKLRGRSFLALGGAVDQVYSSTGKVHGLMFNTSGVTAFLPDQPDVGGTFTYVDKNGETKNESLYLNPGFSMVYKDGPFSNIFKKDIKSVDELEGVLHLPDNKIGIPGALTKSLKVPMAFAFAPEISFRTGWLRTNRDGGLGSPEVYFVDDEAIDVYQHPGWRTQYLSVEKGFMKRFFSGVFFGLGNCPYDARIMESDYLRIKGDDDLIMFFLRVLRTHCLTAHFQQVKNLLVEGILKISLDDEGLRVFKIVKDNDILSAPKLTKLQTAKISAAFELSIMSQLYLKQVSRHTDSFYPKAPDGGRISPSAHFFTKYILMGISESKKVIGKHFVRVMRNMVTTLNTVMVKLDQDRERLEDCKDCGEDITLISNDKKQLTALSQFIIHYVRYVNDGESQGDFNSYFKNNKINIAKMAGKKLAPISS